IRHTADNLFRTGRLAAELVHGKGVAVELWQAVHAQLHTGPKERFQFHRNLLAYIELLFWRNDAQKSKALRVWGSGVIVATVLACLGCDGTGTSSPFEHREHYWQARCRIGTVAGLNRRDCECAQPVGAHEIVITDIGRHRAVDDLNL